MDKSTKKTVSELVGMVSPTNNDTKGGSQNRKNIFELNEIAATGDSNQFRFVKYPGGANT